MENRYKNGLNYQKCPYFYNAIQKYGWDNFEHIVLIDDLNKETADVIEKELIQKYHTTKSECGYNLQSGGSNGKPNKATRIKMSKNHADVSGKNNPMYCKKHSVETRMKMSKNRPSYKGCKNPNYGKKCSEYTKEMTRISNNKPVLQLDKSWKVIKRWNSATDAGNELNISICNISKVCIDLRGTAGKFRWMFEDEKRDPNAIEFIDGRKLNTKPIIQKDKNGNIIKRFNSIKEAQNETKITSISNCLSGRYKSAGGYIWEYEKGVV